MKKLNKFFGLMLITGSMAFISTAKADDTLCTGYNYSVTKENGDHACFNIFVDAIAAIKADGTKAELSVLQDLALSDLKTIDTDLVINLNGHTAKTDGASKRFKISGADVTFKNGTIQGLGAGNAMIDVDSTSGATTLNIEDDVKIVHNQNSSVPVIQVSNASNETILNLKGEWSVTDELVDCGSTGENLTVNLNAKVTGNKALATLDAGTSVVNVLGGDYKVSGDSAFILKNGTLNIEDGNIVSTGADVIKVQAADTGKSNSLIISGGDISTNKIGSYALTFGGAGTNPLTGDYTIAGGSFTSGKGTDGKQLPALNIIDWVFLTNHPGMISNGKFTGSIVGVTSVEGGLQRPAANATANLVGEAGITEENGVVTVGNKSEGPSDEPGDEPGTEEPGTEEPGNNEPEDSSVDENEENPQTGDNVVGSIAMGLTGLMGIVGSAFVFDKKNKLQ